MAFFGPPPPFVGATTTEAGVSGLVPAPASGNSSRALLSNSTFRTPLPLPKQKPTSHIVGVTHTAAALTTGLGSFQPAAKERNFTLINIPSDGDIDELFFRTGTSSPSPAYNVDVALWKINENGDPSDYIIGGTASTGTSANTDVSIAVSSTSVDSGLYYISFTSEVLGSSSSISSITANSLAFTRRIRTANLGSSGLNPYYIATTYNQTTHETILYQAGNAANSGFRYA